LDRVGALFPLFGAVAVRDAAGMSIATFWLLLILQHTDFRQTKAMQLKLDELLRAVEQARIDLVHIEAKPEEQIESLDEEFERLQEQASQRSPSSGAQP
jgi:low affinity Fe/Cu permease